MNEVRLIDADKLKTKSLLRCACFYGVLEDDIDKAPTVDAVPVKHGHWISYPDCGVTRCSMCDWSIEEAWGSNYCPNCGARMDEVVE